MERDIIVRKSMNIVEGRYSLNLDQERLLTLIFSDYTQTTGETGNIWICKKIDFETMFATGKLSDDYIISTINNMLDKTIELTDGRNTFQYKIIDDAEYKDGEIKLTLSQFIASELALVMWRAVLYN